MERNDCLNTDVMMACMFEEALTLKLGDVNKPITLRDYNIYCIFVEKAIKVLSYGKINIDGTLQSTNDDYDLDSLIYVENIYENRQIVKDFYDNFDSDNIADCAISSTNVLFSRYLSVVFKRKSVYQNLSTEEKRFESLIYEDISKNMDIKDKYQVVKYIKNKKCINCDRNCKNKPNRELCSFWNNDEIIGRAYTLK